MVIYLMDLLRYSTKNCVMAVCPIPLGHCQPVFRAVGSNFLVVRPTSCRSACMDREFRMIVFVQSTISMGSMLMLSDLRACPVEKILKIRCFEIEFEDILGSYPCIIAIHAGSYQVTVCQTIARTCSC